MQRTLKFVKYLPEFSWQPLVLTCQPPEGTLRDESLLEDVPANLAVRRTKALVPSPRLPWRLRHFISRWLLVVDEQVGWYPYACRAGMRWLRDMPAQVIFSSAPPYTTHLVAKYLHQQARVPWVADFRDQWIGNWSIQFPSPLHHRFAARLEREILQQADHVLVVSQPMGDSFRERIEGIDASKISWIPNGFDPDDFSRVEPAERQLDCFYLVYTGSFYAHDLTALPILRAVHDIVSNNKVPRTHFRLRLVGNTGKSTARWITELDLQDVVETPGYVAHKHSIAYLLAADAVLLVIGSSPASQLVYTGKVFEYLGSEKPVLCLAKDGVAAELIRRSGSGIVVPPDDIDQISHALVEMYHRWQSGELAGHPDQSLIQCFNRRNQARQLAEIFSRISAREG